MTDINLHKPIEFDRRFEEHLEGCETYLQAYHLTEQDYKAIFGERKYSSYNSFRNAYNTRRQK